MDRADAILDWEYFSIAKLFVLGHDVEVAFLREKKLRQSSVTISTGLSLEQYLYLKTKYHPMEAIKERKDLQWLNWISKALSEMDPESRKDNPLKVYGYWQLLPARDGHSANLILHVATEANREYAAGFLEEFCYQTSCNICEFYEDVRIGGIRAIQHINKNLFRRRMPKGSSIIPIRPQS